MSERICLDCGERLRGRSDKKFCSDQCRNSYNNRINRETNSYVRNIQGLLRRNRRILSELYDAGNTYVHRDALLVAGFSNDFLTHIVESENGAVCRYCFEYGFTEDDNGYINIIINPSLESIE